MDAVKIVVRFANGRLLKGFTGDFFPNKPAFHVEPGSGGKGEEVHLKNLKAIFFVKDFAGDSVYQEEKAFGGGQRPTGRKIEVTFNDGEILVGTTLGYDSTRPGFFLTPSDPKSNNLRVFVVASALNKSRFL